MTPKEKALQLVEYYLNVLGDEFDREDHWYFYGDKAKQCALISVDEIVKSMPQYPLVRNGTHFYWEEVKQEIEKL